MPAEHCLTAVAAALPIANLDTDRIMPKQFLQGIDKAGLAQGALYDRRFDTAILFYSLAVNNGLLLAAVSQSSVERFVVDIQDAVRREMTVNIQALAVRSRHQSARFELSSRHHRMFLEGMDLSSASLAPMPAIEAFERSHWQNQPWLKSGAASTRERLK